MKKRIFGILLMGAMVVASMSMFTSCKDYDDDIQANKDDITALKTQLATLQTALTTAQSAATAAQSAADAAATAAKNAQTAADNAGTAAKNAQASADDAAKAASANATAIKAAQDAIKALEDQVAAFAKVEELNAVKADLEKAIADATAGKVSAEELTEALKPISAKITAIDESLNTLDGDVKALKEWKSTVEGQIASVLADLKSQADAIKALQDEIKNKITKGDLSGLANEDAIKAYVDNQLKAYAQNSEVSAAVANALKNYTTTADLQKLLASYSTPAAVTTAIEDALKSYYTVAKTDEMISTLTTAVNNAKAKAEAAQTEDQVKAIAQAIANEVSENAGENINTLNVLVNKILTSVTLVPELYVKGVEAIEFKSLKYTPMEFVAGANDVFGDGILTDLTPTGADAVVRDNAETEASYRLSPAAVKLEDIDEANIAFFGRTAATRAATTTKNSPVKYVAGSASLANGILTVKLAKSGTAALKGAEEPGDIDIVSLMVPRKEIAEKNQEYAEIYSEFARVVETTFTPRIAALPWDADNAHVTPTDLTYHYSDSTTIWTDEAGTANTKLVKKDIKYDAEFDLLTLVTGCELNAGHLNQITKEELAKYGLEFRFAIPTTVYNTAADHNTNQQKFAKLKADGHTLISCIENGTEKNKAATGKEPIIRVTLVDKANNNIVDQRYLKIKWVEDDAPNKPAVDLGTVTKNSPFTCDDANVELTWVEFINDVYGKVIEDQKEDMSQETFESIYPVDDVVVTVTPDKNALNAAISQPVVKKTTNAEGDALIANWTLTQDDWGKIPAGKISDGGGKKIVATITFKSKQPKAYGDLKLNWVITRELPAAPILFGYNANQWFDAGNKFYVQPVQYKTNDSKGVNRTDEVSYDFNIMQQFTVATATAPGTYLNWILKGVQDCGSWDMQFAKTQVNSTYHPAYVTASSVAEPLETEGVGQTGFDAYELQKDPTETALTLNWIQPAHKSWQNKEETPYAVLNGVKANAEYIAPLLNDLSKENEADGWTPKKTNTDSKSVTLKVFAKYNAYNVIEVTSFKAYLVTPIRINHEIEGAFEDNWISGTVVDAMGKLAITDFVGYAVAKTASGRAGERYKYESQLWNYYGLQDPSFSLGDNIKYGLKMENGSLVVDNDVTVSETGNDITGGLTQTQVKQNTGGAYQWSITATGGKLVFKNETGRAFDKKFNVFVPVSVKHHFGEVKMYVKIPVYPKGQAAADGITVIPAE